MKLTNLFPTSQTRILDNAVKVIDTEGWTQNAMRNYEGEVCALGALQRGAGARIFGLRSIDDVPRLHDKAYQRALHHLALHAVEHDSQWMRIGSTDDEFPVTYYNDQIARDQSDVIALLRETSECVRWEHLK